jgi:hypothetical protein
MCSRPFPALRRRRRVGGGAGLIMLSCYPAILLSLPPRSTMRVWDVSTHRLLATRKQHTLGIRSVAYNTVSEVLVTVGFDFFAQGWGLNVAYGAPVFRLVSHAKPLVSVAALGSKPQCVTADEGGVFKVRPMRLYAQSCARVHASMCTCTCVHPWTLACAPAAHRKMHAEKGISYRAPPP